jgi:DNA-binding transcriptional LysR family regulator
LRVRVSLLMGKEAADGKDRIGCPKLSVQAGSGSRTFVIGAFDCTDLPLLTAVRAILRSQAPSIDFRVKAVPPADIGRALRQRHIDAAIGPLAAAPDDAHSTALFVERLVMIARRDHPALRKALTVKTFAALPHVRVSARGAEFGSVDRALSKLGLSRRFARTVPHFNAAALLVEVSDFVAAIPERVAERMQAVGRVEVHELPLLVLPWTVGLMQTKDSLEDVGMRCLVASICSVAAEI